MSDVFKTVRAIQKGLDAMSKKLENSKNERIHEINKRLKEVNKKITDQFGERTAGVRKRPPVQCKKSISVKKTLRKKR